MRGRAQGPQGPLAREWASYRERVVPADASLFQVQECRRAFYAGARALYYTVMEGLTPGPDHTADDEALMLGLHAELEQFVADVKRGAA